MEKASGKIGLVRTAYNERNQAVVNFGEGWVKVIPYKRLQPLAPSVKVVKCISDQYSNFICDKTYIAEATACNIEGTPINFEIIDEDGFEFPAITTLFEEVK
jgi:hypothetical protein